MYSGAGLLGLVALIALYCVFEIVADSNKMWYVHM